MTYSRASSSKWSKRMVMPFPVSVSESRGVADRGTCRWRAATSASIRREGARGRSSRATPYRRPGATRAGPSGWSRYGGAVLLSDRDIRAQIDSGRVVLDPYDPSMVQPSSIDVRLDKYFRLFDNHKYAVIDPAQEQPELTHLVEVEGDDPFVLHPGEFVLASTYEAVTLPDDVAARLEGKSSLGRLGLLTH